MTIKSPCLIPGRDAEAVDGAAVLCAVRSKNWRCKFDEGGETIYPFGIGQRINTPLGPANVTDSMLVEDDELLGDYYFINFQTDECDHEDVWKWWGKWLGVQSWEQIEA